MTFQQAMAATYRELDVKATITLVGGYVINANKSQIMEFSVSDGNSTIPLGTCVSGIYTLDLANSEGEWLKGGATLGARVLMGAKVALEIGVYHDSAWDWKPSGVFYVNKTSATENDTRMRLSGYDPLVELLDIPYNDTLGYRSTRTLQQVLDHIRSKGVTINGTLACNTTAIISKEPDWGDECTIRTALGYVAQMGGCFVRCSRTGVPELVRTQATSINRTITTDTYLDLTDDENYFNFNRIKAKPVGASKKKDEYVESYITSIPESSANTLMIDENPLLRTIRTTSYSKTSDTSIKNKKYYTKTGNKYTVSEEPVEEALPIYYNSRNTYNTTTLQGMVDGLKSALTGLAYRSLSINYRGDPTLMVGDRITLTDTKGTSTTFTIIQQRLLFDGGLKSEITCPLDLASVIPATIMSNGAMSTPRFGIGSIDASVLVAGTIMPEHIAAGSVTADSIASKTITADEITAKSITADEIAAKTITAGEIKADTLTAEEIAAGQITAKHVSTNEIIANTANIKNGVITNAKIADATIETAKIKDAQITNAKIANAAIDTAQIKDAAIKTAKIDDAQITTAKIGNAQITNAKIADATIQTAKIGDAQITNAKIANAGIDFAKVRDLSADTSIFRLGVGGNLYLDRLVVNDANFASAIAGKLMIRDDNGKLYRISIDANGAVTSTLVQLDGDSLTENAVMSVSQRLLWRQATAPSAPFIGMLWQDTTKDQLKRCTSTSPLVWEIVPAGRVHTNVIDVDDNGMNILTGGDLNLLAGSNINIKNLGNTANVINMDSTGLTLSSTGQLKLQSTDSITIGGSPFNVGGTNLIWKTSGDEGAAGRLIWSSSGLMQFAVESTWVLKGCKPTRIFGSTGTYALFYTLGLTNHPFVTDDKYTLSFYTYALSSVSARISDAVSTNLVIDFGALTPKWTRPMMTSNGLLSISYFEVTGTVTGTQSSPTLLLSASAVNGDTRFYCVQLEKGPIATDWSPAPQDTIDALTGIGTSIGELQTQIDGKIDTYFGSNDPSSGWTPAQKAAAVGDMWYNSTAKKLKRWNGTSWDDITDQTAIDAYANAATAKDTADGKRRVFVSQPVPPYDVGDLWAGGSAGDLKRCSTAKATGGAYAAGDWVLATKYTDDTAYNTFVANTLPGLQARVQVFYQTTKPTYTAVGDLWYDTDSNPLEVWKCTNVSTQAHTEFTDPVLTRAISAQTTANSKINTFVGSSTPTALAAGDLWMDTGNKNIWKRATAAGTGGWMPYLTAAGYVNSTGITIDGTDLTVKATGNLNLAADGNMNVQSGGNLNVLNGGDIEISNGGDINVASGGKINITTANDLMLGAQNITAFADERIDVKADSIDLSANSSVKLSVGLNGRAFGSNLLAEAKYTSNKFLDGMGVENSNPSYLYSDYISVLPGEVYAHAGVSTLGVSPATVFYTSAKAFHSAVSGASRGMFVVPAGCHFLRHSIFASDVGTTRVEKVNTAAGANILDGVGRTSGFYLNWEGSVVSNAAWTFTNYVPVFAGETYEMSNHSTGTSPATVFYAADKTYVGTVVGTERSRFTVPAGVAFIRHSILATDLSPQLIRITNSKGVKTSYIDIATDHIDISTGGNITMGAGALMKLLAAVVQIDASDASNSYINFGNAFNVSKGADGNFALTINSPTDNAIMVNNKPVWHKGNILVQQDQPASGSGVLWMKPVTTSQVIYAMTVASKSSSTYSGNGYKEYSLANQSADVMSTAGTYSFALKFTLRHYGDGNYTVSQITITLTKGGKTLTLYTGAVTVGGWSSKEVTAAATTTDTDFTSGTGVINCKIQPSGTIPYTTSDFLAHEVGSPITTTITGPGGGGSAQLCEVKYVP